MMTDPADCDVTPPKRPWSNESSEISKPVEETSPGVTSSPEAAKSSSFGKSIPIHCTVCSVEIDSNGNRVEDRGLSDAYAIVPVETPFVDLVPTALAKLGFSGAECVYATGALVIKNWKPLALQEVCISQSATVGEMLAELTTMITLSIRVYRRSSACWIESIREKLASFALGLVWSQGDGAAGGCPVDQATLEKLFDGSGDLKAVPLVSEETRCGLERWLAQQVRQLATTSHNNNKGPVGGNVSPDCGGGPSGHCGPSTAEVHLAPCATVSAAQPPHPPPPAATSTIVLPPPQQQQQQQLPPPAPAPPIPPPLPLRLNTPHLWHHPSPMFRPLVPNGAHDGHFEIKSEGMHRVRVRTSFDSELELPKLQHWFAENPHPSKQQIQDYVRILNAQESRRGRKQLDVTNVMYWFKNARAAHKRAEIRHQQLHQTSPMQHRSLGYSSSSEMSLSERGMKEDGEDAEEDDDDELDLTDFDDDDEDDNEVATEKSDGRADDEETEAQQAVFPGTGDASPRGFHQEYMQRFGFHPAHHHPAFMSPRISAAAAAALMTNPYVQHSLANISGLDLSCREGFSEVSQPASEERKKRNRTFIDPITEVPRLEQWFSGNSHPPHSMILRFTQELNAMPYRQKFPKLEAKNVQFWFKNRRAKCKRMKMSLTMP